MTLKALIIDDEVHFRIALKQMLQNNSFVEIVGEANSVRSAKLWLSQNNADLIFLDVEMPDGLGFDLINSLAPKHYKIIFTTGHSQYAVKAFKYSAIDYLLKPIDKEELNTAIEKVQSANYYAEMEKKMQVLLSNREEFEKIALISQGEIQMVDIGSIIRCQSDSNYTRFFLKNGRHLIVSKVLKAFEEVLSVHGFFRVHKSHLINITFVKKYVEAEGGYVLMADGTKIMVSRRRKKEFLNELTKKN